MPTYMYEIIDTGEKVEVEHSIKEKAWDVIEVDGEWKACRRLVYLGGGFFLKSGPSGGWADQGYSKPESHRQAEQILGRKLIRPGGGQ